MFWVAYTSGTYGRHASFALIKSADFLNWTFVGDISTAIPGATDSLTWGPIFFRDGDGSIHILVAISLTGGGTFNPTPDLRVHEMHPLDAGFTQWSAPVPLPLPTNWTAGVRRGDRGNAQRQDHGRAGHHASHRLAGAISLRTPLSPAARDRGPGRRRTHEPAPRSRPRSIRSRPKRARQPRASSSQVRAGRNTSRCATGGCRVPQTALTLEVSGDLAQLAPRQRHDPRSHARERWVGDRRCRGHRPSEQLGSALLPAQGDAHAAVMPQGEARRGSLAHGYRRSRSTTGIRNPCGSEAPSASPSSASLFLSYDCCCLWPCRIPDWVPFLRQ